MSVKETRRMREMEELIDLQDKAIQALQQAAAALSLALQSMKQSMDEKGQQNKFTFHPQYIPMLAPSAGGVTQPTLTPLTPYEYPVTSPPQYQYGNVAGSQPSNNVAGQGNIAWYKQ
jgi:hypothetical protein